MNALHPSAPAARWQRWLWVPVTGAALLWAGCGQAQDTVDEGPATPADSAASLGWREATGLDPSDPFSAPAEAVAGYLDRSLAYLPVATYNVDPGDGSADSVAVRFESVRGSHMVPANALATDGHVVYRYILEDRSRSVPWLGLTPNDTLGYFYMLPGAVEGPRERYRAQFAVRTDNGGWREVEGSLSVVVMDPPSDAPEGSWVMWGDHRDDAYTQRINEASQELFGSVRAMGAQDHCFACMYLWCWVVTD